MKGYVPTPPAVVDLMVDKLFAGGPPDRGTRLLDPGCGQGAFIDGVLRWSRRTGCATPRIVAIEADPLHAEACLSRFRGHPAIEVRQADFLTCGDERFDHIVANPPYVPITGLDSDERARYRARFATAIGRFDLYLLFFEQALRLLAPGGRLVFITPEKYLYVASAAQLRGLLKEVHVEELHFLDEETFGGLVTYPLITTVNAELSREPTRIIRRGGSRGDVHLPESTDSWLPAVGEDHSSDTGPPGLTLADCAQRISCGVATGADDVFLHPTDELPGPLRRFAHPTVSGRELKPGRPLRSSRSLLVPYTVDGALLAESELGALGDYLTTPRRREHLLRRTCVSRKPWYAFHENPPLTDLLRPKVLCKDVVQAPFFVPDLAGDIVPRHSVYYIVPLNPDLLPRLLEYLNSPSAAGWLARHCQRAASGFLRLQSHVLKRLPVPLAVMGAEASTPELAAVEGA